MSGAWPERPAPKAHERVRMTLSAVVAAHARRDPEGIAFAGAGARTWQEYDADADAVAATLAARFPERGTRVAAQMPDGGDVHVLYLAAERAGLIAVGIGPRAGRREVDHVCDRTGAAVRLTDLPDRGDPGELDPRRALGPDELSFLNSTSGTTGLPKLVMHQQSRWFAFHELAVRTGALTSAEVFMSVLPSPFGFGLWTAHFTPAILGAPCVLLDHFTPEAALDAIDAFGVTVLAAVSTQFVMLLESPALGDHDLSSLRVLYTGGERVPADRAGAFEDRTGARVLQFYGSNETGALSATSLSDDRRVRLETAGRVIPELHVRLLDPGTGADVTATGGPGVAACRGAVNCLGYWDDEAADAELFTPDG